MKRVLGVILLIATVPCAFGGAVAAFFGAAFVVPQAAAFASAGLVACFLIAAALAWGGLKLWGVRSARAWGLGVAAVLTGIAVLTLLVPGPIPRPQPRLDTQYWDLPTGSRIAYVHFAAAGNPKPEPVIVLHGGPGLPFAPETADYYGQIAQDGFDVYVYDQVGAGLSSRLPDITQYTVQRNVADLEAVRQAIGVDQVILIGSSWGGALAAHYLAAYPEHVAKVIFSGPAQLMGARSPGGPSVIYRTAASPGQRKVNLSLRFRVAQQLLASASLPAALSFMSQDEYSAAMAQFIDPGLAYCQRDADKVEPTFERPGYNYFVSTATLFDLSQNAADVRPALTQVQTPALVLRGECDYMYWEVTREYRQLLPNARLVYIEGAGHALTATQPATTMAVMRAFLLDEKLPIEPYEGEADPAGY